MLSAYPACFFHEGNGFSVIFPDLNYLSTCGDSLNEALEMSIELLLLWFSPPISLLSEHFIVFMKDRLHLFLTLSDTNRKSLFSIVHNASDHHLSGQHK